ncbi:outer membrane beta-barrel domain-containing protein [Alkalilimnicola ehrlichii]|uniref:Outer membrane beta-barrel domain-containing protein n=1 Tax=Alkalilimnicola ehrlichii TaxID=351052 RepID=A0A3E0X3H8_9GAMM|nr:outer membrane beta-barrel domain-containing protein [Alkalilimnicola ehrlichii]RFA30927.1 outer membrane beta-barrel domain-containing protein [Alkalilimnicola ehrlichii]RFA38877.1 outer membrane beta-barrel domain-containing protein [Alkalilimnicola ehrlichii]
MKRWLVFLILLAFGSIAAAQIPEPRERQAQAIEPRLERPDIVIPRIDDENFEFNLFVGVLSIENFGSDFVYGLRGALHVNESIFFEASFGLSEVSDRSFRRLGIPLFGSQREDVEYYNLSIAYNAFPGEVFRGDGRVYSSTLFLVAGAGNIRIASEDYFTYNIGLGFRILPNEWLSLRLDVRNHIFDNDLLGESKTTHNPEVTFGLGVYF